MNMATNANHQSTLLPATAMTHTTIPISRSSGTAYDRPERARTSHACEPCRERKTKCDGERPFCRRCLHTGTGCHYGYGKGWRKRKTAEDLTATSSRLARYEALLNDIMPMVPPNVKSMIEDAREQVHNDEDPFSNCMTNLPKDIAGSISTGSETTESNEPPPRIPSLNGEKSTSSSTSRVSLPLPVPSSLGTQGSRAPIPRSFESMSSSSSNNPIPRPSSRRLSPDDTIPARLPSIRPDGLLFDPGVQALGPRLSEDAPTMMDGVVPGGTSVTGHGYQEGRSLKPDQGRVNADGEERDLEAAFAAGVKPVAAPG